MSSRKNRRLMGHINVVPYIDVMLVLLIIFMITAPMLQQGIEVNLPEVDSEPLSPEDMQDNEVLILSIDAEGLYYINIGGDDPEAPVDAETVFARTAAVLRRNENTPVVVKADESALHGRVARGMALLQQAGAKSIGILTDPPETETL